MNPETPTPGQEHPEPQDILLAPGKREFWLGLIYIPLHLFLIGSIAYLILQALGRTVSMIELNLIALLIGTVYLMLIMRRFLQASFTRFLAFGTRNFRVFTIGYGLRIALGIPITIAIMSLAPAGSPNPNQEAVSGMMDTYFLPSLFLVVVLAPIVEEILFRGVIFGPLHRRNRVLAYTVSTLVFAFIHVAAFLLLEFHSHLFLTMLLYIPMGISLCWAYEKSGNIWTPILLHGVMNLIAVLLGLVV